MLKNVLVLAVSLAVLAAGLLYLASRLGPIATPQTHKIGPILESHPYPSQPLPNPGGRSVAPATPAPSAAEAPANAAQAPSAPAAAPAPGGPAASVPAPAAAASMGEPTPSAPDPAAAPETPGARYPKGYAGCDHYKSYDPATQTFKTLDGRIMPCKVQ